MALSVETEGETMLVREVMTPDPLTVRTGASLKTALRLLDENDISSLPVVDEDGRICGVVSEADLIRDLVGPDQRLHELPVTEPVPPQGYVDDVMTTHAITVRPESDLTDAVELVTSTGIKCLPVVDGDDHVIGVISRRDVVRILARADETLEQEADALLVAAGMRDWLVDVHDGIAEVTGPESSKERLLAKALVSSVPGVVAVNVG
jgi:CBS domain-containing protein